MHRLCKATQVRLARPVLGRCARLTAYRERYRACAPGRQCEVASATVLLARWLKGPVRDGGWGPGHEVVG